MSFTQPPEFPTLKQFLFEDDGDELFGGVRRAIDDIRNAWSGGSRQKVERARVGALKKLDPAAQAKLTRVINIFIADVLNNIGAKPTYEVVTRAISNANEAAAVGWVFTDLANLDRPRDSKIFDLASNFLHMANLDKVIDNKEHERLLAHVVDPTMFPVGPDVVNVFKENLEFFKRVFLLDAQLGLNANQGAGLLHRKLGGTTDAGDGKTPAKAVVWVTNGLQRFRLVCLQLNEAIKATGAAKAPPKENPVTGGTGPTPHPAQKKPVTKPGGASMQPQADANQQAARQAGQAMASPAQEQESTMSADQQAEVEAALNQATRLSPVQVKKLMRAGVVSKLPAKMSAADAIKHLQAEIKAGRIKV